MPRTPPQPRRQSASGRAEMSVESTTRIARAPGVWWIVSTGLAGLAMAPWTLTLVRDVLHAGCTAAPTFDRAVEWMCGDGISYLGSAVAVGFMTVALIVIGALVAGRTRSDAAARGWLTVLAAVSVGWMLAWTWDASARLVGEPPVGETSAQYWAAGVGPAALVAGASVALAAAGLLLTGSAARWVGAASVVGLVIATVLQPGIGPATLLAGGLVVAAALRARRREGEG